MKTKLIQLLATSLLLMGCVSLYKPTVVQSPLLKEEGEARVTGSIGLLGTGLYNLQGAYAPKEHVGVLAGGMLHTERTNEESGNPEVTSIYYGEAGGGYYTTFGKKDRGLFQCYGGIGMGGSNSVKHMYDQTEPRLSANYISAFIQPGIAFASRNFDAALDVRNNVVHLYNTNAYLMEEFEFWNTQTTFHADTTMNFLLLEPTLTLRFGPEQVKGFIQLGLTFPTWNSDVYFDVFGSSLLLGQFFKFSIGITYLFPTKPKKQLEDVSAR